jgi:SAM-dependent methyltransferase
MGMSRTVHTVLRHSGLRDVVRWSVATSARAGAPVRLATADRMVLETRILPEVARLPECRRLLFVGVDWYTVAYERVFRRQEYWTLEPMADRKVYGSRRHHIGTAQDAARLFEPGYLDCVICNGVFGWGIQTRPEWENALDSFYKILRHEGRLILGWDDIAAHKPFPPMDTVWNAGFEAASFPGFEGSTYCVKNGSPHVYEFLKKGRKK